MVVPLGTRQIFGGGGGGGAQGDSSFLTSQCSNVVS